MAKRPRKSDSPDPKPPANDEARRALIARAEALGIDGASLLTQAELVEELRRAEQGPRGTGLIERATTWLRETVTQRIAGPPPTIDAAPIEPPVELPEPALASVEQAATDPMLEAIRRAQGLLPTEPERETPRVEPVAAESFAARPKAEIAEDGPRGLDAIAHLSPADFREATVAPPPVVPAMLDDEPWPERYGVDECVAMPVDATTLYVYWELRVGSIARARRALLRGAGTDEEPRGVLRVLSVEPDVRGPRIDTRDLDVLDASMGEHFVRELPPGAVLRAAVGLKLGDRFLPLAHTLDVETPSALPADEFARTRVEWTERETRPLHGALPPFPRHHLESSGANLPPMPPPSPMRTDDLPHGVGLSSAALAAWNEAAESRAAVGPGGPVGASERLARARAGRG